ncbi:hydroxyacylglutathione hydrolase [Caldovatus aquaticus]|uniref:Hydroxyacylglutathione hydrolase n=1 Tax=Caldovatus aquaticus TaxID=2865671 RepID=A0ABS7EY26_9PROT|nr:hydroxyacylglutathione hydrolase [Caldovatus aquaticus]MBW8268178.1 hydroxyacylglutathione hydrolase [Caldovatus aquaticus]
MTITVAPVPCLQDNYIWLLRGARGEVALCDPGEAGPAIAAVEEAGGRLDLILLTHHHGDHVAGVAAVKQRFPDARVVGNGADAHRLPPLDLAVSPGDTVGFGGSAAAVIACPGHTRGGISYHFAAGALVLCGDTLFSLGCGRLIEGTAEEMFRSLRALAALPPETLVCCGHEYTESNARFALTVEPDNPALRARAEEARAQRAAGRPTVPTTIAQELATNPFLRAPDVASFARLRAAKDNFR